MKFKQKLVEDMLSDNFKADKKLMEDESYNEFKDIINKVNLNAPVKMIVKNKKKEEILIMFNEVMSEIKKINLKEKIDSLESKVSVNLDEKLYSELLSLRNQLKSS